MILRRIILIAISFIAGASIGRKACSIIAKWRAGDKRGSDNEPEIKKKYKKYKNNVIMFPMDRINKNRMENAGSN